MNKSKQTLFVLIIIFLITCTASTPVCSAQKKTIKVGYLQHYGTIVNSSSGKNTGYGYEYLTEIAKNTQWEYEYVPCGWAEGLDLLENGDIDLFGPMQKNPKREEVFLFPEQQFGYEYGVLYTYKDSELLYNDIENFDGIRVGTEHNNYYDSVLEEFCKDNNINVNLIYTNALYVESELKNGKYDAFISGSLYDIPNSKIVAKMSAESFYYAASINQPEIIDEINRAMELIHKEDAYYAAMLNEKYYGNKSISKPAFTAEELELLKQYPNLKVGVDSDAVPLQYFDEKLGKFCGITIDLLDKIAEECGITFKYYQSDQTDVTLDLYAGYRKNPNSFCTNLSYFDVPMVLVGNKKQNIEAYQSVGMAELDIFSEQALQSSYENLKIKKYEKSEELIQALDSGLAEMIFISLYAYKEMERANGSEEYTSFVTDIKYTMDINCESQLPDEFGVIFSKAIKRISKTELDTIIFENTVGRAYEVPFSQMIKEYVFTIIVVAIVVLLTLVTLILVIVKINKSKSKALSKIAYYDELTDLSTLLKFSNDVENVLETAKPEEYMILAMDIDNFKYINDIFGYDIGNQVIRLVACKIKSEMQSYVFMTRSNADNFIVFCKTTNKDCIIDKYITENMLIKEAKEILGDNYNIKFSMGIYVIEDPKKPLSLMIDYSNLAKKRAKSEYDHSIEVYTNTLDEELKGKREIITDMEKALAQEEFVPFLQPKFSLETRNIIGAEVLVRWFSPKRGLVPPMEFIPLLEQNGFIQELDIYMAEKTCSLIRNWLDRGYFHIPRISINVSKITLMRKDITKILIELTTKYKIEKGLIEVELTESVLDEHTEEILCIMNELKKAGFYVSIDDFGSGFSSLNLLKDIPADVLKIDKGFLSETFTSDKGKIIISNVIRMSKELQIETIAEGIETSEQADILQEMGCNFAQGFYFSKPLPSDEFEKYI